MADWKTNFINIGSQLDDKFDQLSFNLRQRLQLFQPLQVVTYRSYGTPTRLYVKGRVLANKGLTDATDKDTLWNNLLNMYRRFESDEIPNARLRIQYQEQEFMVTTDEEGYFTFNLEPKEPVQLTDIWHYLTAELIDSPLPNTPSIQAQAQILIPPPDAEYGIISDIDDTIVKTDATDLLAMSRNVFMHNAHSRLPFAGVSAFYKSLQIGRNGKRNNPFFYVSSSPWNLYDLLHDFLDIHEIPAGPLLLRDFGLETNKLFKSDHMGHKFREIENILMTYPDLNFVLIGDSGQEDPVIYREVVKKFPTRIICIYIRDVQLPERAKIALEVSEELKKGKVEMIIVENTVKAAEHAAQTGLIYTEEIPAIAADTEKDKLPEKDL